VTASGAVLAGTVDPGGAPTTAFFQYGTTTAYGAVTPVHDAGSGKAASGVSADIAGLSPATIYHFRLVATNATGTTQGADRTFTTAVSIASPPPGDPFQPVSIGSPPPGDPFQPANGGITPLPVPSHCTLGTGGTAAGLVVRVSCDRAATVVLDGTATITKRARAASAPQRRVGVRSVKVQVVAGKRRSITLRLPTSVRKAVGRGDRVSVVLRAAVKTAEGASSTATATVRELKAAKRSHARG
jgi:hypothetical protein